MSGSKIVLPQEGTGSAGESLPGPPSGGSGCPSYSGGGKNRSAARPIYDSDDSDSCDMHEVESSLPTASIWRKRPCAEESGSGSEKASSSAAHKGIQPKRGRGRPPTTGKYVGLAKAKRELIEAQREEPRLEAESADANLASNTSNQRMARHEDLSAPISLHKDDNDGSMADLRKRMNEALEIISTVSKVSKGLKGSSTHALKEAIAEIGVLSEAMASRTMTEEMAVLQANNTRLVAELVALRKEVADLRVERHQAAPPAPPPPTTTRNDEIEDLMRRVMVQTGTMINARLEGLQDRLLPEKRLRPPLAADGKQKREESVHTTNANKKDKKRGAQTPSVPSITDMEAWPRLASTTKPQRAGRSKQDVTAAAGASSRERLVAVLGAPDSDQITIPKASEEWQTATKKKKRRRKDKKTAKETKKKDKEKVHPTPKLRSPQSSVVVLTLLPAAVERGTTYARILTEAKGRIDVAGLGIQAMRLKAARTGARMLEIPGVTSGVKADALAAKLREVFDPEDLKIARPVRSVNLRVLGLDDSTSPDEVREAVARAGEVPADQVKVGPIRFGLTGAGTTIVACPVAAARRFLGRRLLIGWVSAQVKILEPRPQRCFRCLEPGHVAAKCTSAVDRSTVCYRCGTPGHKANECEGTPNCALCATGGKPSGHRLGGKACGSTLSPGRKVKKKGGGMAAETSSLPAPQGAATMAPTQEAGTDRQG